MTRIVRISYKVKGIKKTQSVFAGMTRRSQSFAHSYRWARRELQRWNAANFATGGVVSGNKWNALDTEYHSWKIAHHGPLPTMVRTGDLYRDLVTLRGRANHIGHKDASFGTDIEYAKFHQTGTKFMPKRKIVFTPNRFADKLGERIVDYIIYGRPGTRAYKRLKGQLHFGRDR
ncbi:MAG TPA: hypothetical protein EYQ50_10960 [Verrucomicrobiales bacterium]|nr:hypothetical protein [Verrucomicrobiales bacterium]